MDAQRLTLIRPNIHILILDNNHHQLPCSQEGVYRTTI